MVVVAVATLTAAPLISAIVHYGSDVVWYDLFGEGHYVGYRYSRRIEPKSAAHALWTTVCGMFFEPEAMEYILPGWDLIGCDVCLRAQVYYEDDLRPWLARMEKY